MESVTRFFYSSILAGFLKKLGSSFKRAFSFKTAKEQSVEDAVAEAEAALREMFPPPGNP